MNILEKILDAKREELQHLRAPTDRVKKFDHVRSLNKALESTDISVIAEIKMKSPSEGYILSNADPVQIAKDYESAGAAAISVLTDRQFFGGSLTILESVREAVSIPVLCKDFIIHEHQIMDLAQARADAYFCLLYTSPSPRDRG